MTFGQTICDYLSKAVASVAVVGMLAGCTTLSPPQLSGYQQEELPQKWKDILSQGVVETEEGYSTALCVIADTRPTAEDSFMLRSRTSVLTAINSEIKRKRTVKGIETTISAEGEIYGVQWVDSYEGYAELSPEDIVKGFVHYCREYFAPKVNKLLNRGRK